MAFFRLLRKVPLLVFAVIPGLAHACTVCDSHTAHRVRAGIFNGHFLHTVWLIAIPFPVFAIAIGLLHFGMPDLDPETAVFSATQAESPAPRVTSILFARAEPTP